MKAISKSKKPQTVDQYLTGFKGDARKTLDHLREIIRSTAPQSEEVISYGIPTYKLNGMLVSFGGFKEHCSLFGMSSQLGELVTDLKPYQTGPGTLRFEPGKRLPVALIKKVIKLRIKENAAKAAARLSPRPKH